MTTIYLIGDGILDNYKWLNEQTKDLTYELHKNGATVFNYAYNDTSVKDIINGCKIDSENKQRKHNIVDKNGYIFPLKLIGDAFGVNQSFSSALGQTTSITSDKKFIVLSMGGNDINGHILHLPRGPEKFMENVLSKVFIANYERVIETIRSSCKNIILISVYLPYLGSGSKYGKFSGYATTIATKWQSFTHGIGRKYDIPVLDLLKTFNSQDRSHYGTSDVHVSNKSNKCMADCIIYITKHYHGFGIYYAPNCGSEIKKEK